MSQHLPDDLDSALAPHLEYFAERVNLLFAYHFCTLEFEHDQDFTRDASENDRAWSLKTIQNACLHTSLIALRDLDDFFTPRNRTTRSDDLRASDFGLARSLSYLTKGERERINKLIAHSTQHGAANVDYKWDILEMMSKAVPLSLAFLDWIKTDYSLLQFNMWTAAAGIYAKTNAVFEYVKKEAEKRRVQ
ncbi:MAG TPA: hypothetical protein VEL06_01365 [Haliangiales bacterium]|nr:hypothetical protein [Haliangiales bacterium]